MKGKQPLFIFALKSIKKYGSKTKRKENTEAKRSKRKMWKQKKYGSETKRKEKYWSEKKNMEAKRSKKMNAKFSLNKAKRKRNESYFVSL